MQISLKRSERDSLKPDHGSEHLSGLLVIISTFLMICHLDHAHPNMVAGHPFKGSWVYSTGQLLHPDLKRFAIGSPVLFKPVMPVAAAAATVPSFQ